MANEIRYDNLGDLRTAEVIGLMWMLTLADRAAIVMHPALTYVGSIVRRGSRTINATRAADTISS